MQATLLLMINSEVIKFRLVFAEASPAKHIVDTHTWRLTWVRKLQVAFCKKGMATQKGIRTIKWENQRYKSAKQGWEEKWSDQIEVARWKPCRHTHTHTHTHKHNKERENCQSLTHPLLEAFDQNEHYFMCCKTVKASLKRTFSCKESSISMLKKEIGKSGNQTHSCSVR